MKNEILSRIESPADLRTLSDDELQQLQASGAVLFRSLPEFCGLSLSRL
jgi:hypothetical protein